MKGDSAIASFVKETLPIEEKPAAAGTNSYRITRTWFLVTAAAPLLISGNFGQNTSLGFAAFSSGLSVAAIRLRPEQNADLSGEESLETLSGPIARPSRSTLAGRLHANTQKTRSDA